LVVQVLPLHPWRGSRGASPPGDSENLQHRRLAPPDPVSLHPSLELSLSGAHSKIISPQKPPWTGGVKPAVPCLHLRRRTHDRDNHARAKRRPSRVALVAPPNRVWAGCLHLAQGQGLAALAALQASTAAMETSGPAGRQRGPVGQSERLQTDDQSPWGAVPRRGSAPTHTKKAASYRGLKVLEKVPGTAEGQNRPRVRDLSIGRQAPMPR